MPGIDIFFLGYYYGKRKRDEYLKNTRISSINFLPERPYETHGVKAIPRKGSRDFYMFFVSREQDVKPHLVMKENETLADVGANIGSYSLKIANDYKKRSRSRGNRSSSRKF